MFDSTALEVVIGLIFIYLLYSLMATVLSEMIASLLGLRARNLKEAINRMLTTGKIPGWLGRLRKSLRIFHAPENPVINRFYQNPEIKNLGGTGLFRKPSAIRPESFSKALLDELCPDGDLSDKKIEAALKKHAGFQPKNEEEERNRGCIDSQPANYVLSLWRDSGFNVDRFTRQLEEWFNRTMEQASEWYKRKIQLILLVLGFFMAWFFCADTFLIVSNLSVDKQAREQLVALANARVATADPGDSLLTDIRKKLNADMASANTILGLGGWLPDRVLVKTDPQTLEKTYTPRIDPESLPASHGKLANGTLTFLFGDKLTYFLNLGWNHFFGFLVTAIAVSLGAPFWFDLLNRVMRLRTSLRDEVKKDRNK